MNLVTKYIAWDGKEFFTAHDCSEYEKQKDMLKAIKEFEEHLDRDAFSYRYSRVPDGLAKFLADRFMLREKANGEVSSRSDNNG